MHGKLNILLNALLASLYSYSYHVAVISKLYLYPNSYGVAVIVVIIFVILFLVYARPGLQPVTKWHIVITCIWALVVCLVYNYIHPYPSKHFYITWIHKCPKLLSTWTSWFGILWGWNYHKVLQEVHKGISSFCMKGEELRLKGC